MYERLHQRFWSLLHSALTSHPQAMLVMLESNEARLLLNNERLLVILLDEQPKEHVALQNWAKVLLEDNPLREIDIFVVAPSSEVDQTLSEMDFQVPWTTRLSIITVNEDGVVHEITANQADGFDRHILEVSTGVQKTALVLKQEVKAIVEAQSKSTGDVVRFQEKLASHTPVATYVLLATICAFYVMQIVLGADSYVPGLVRMGADSAELVSQGQYWRLVTSIFLHGSFLHIAMNGYVLYALGVFFNKLIGNARFLTLFFVSGACGSMASVFISHASLSVGASGALWGLFGLGAALIIKPSHFLPDFVRQNLRNVTLINLAINIVFSFAIPMIDKWAHFGGGVAGFLIGLAFVFEPEYRMKERLHVFLASLTSLIAVLCLGVNFYFERPWVLSQPLTLTPRTILNGDLSLLIPDFLKLRDETNNKVTFGDINFEPYEIVVLVQKLNITVEELKHDLESNINSPIQSTIVNGLTMFSTYVEDTKTHVHDWRWWLLRGGDVIFVEVAARDGVPKGLIEKLERIPESISSPLRI